MNLLVYSQAVTHVYARMHACTNTHAHTQTHTYTHQPIHTFTCTTNVHLCTYVKWWEKGEGEQRGRGKKDGGREKRDGDYTKRYVSNKWSKITSTTLMSRA